MIELEGTKERNNNEMRYRGSMSGAQETPRQSQAWLSKKEQNNAQWKGPNANLYWLPGEANLKRLARAVDGAVASVARMLVDQVQCSLEAVALQLGDALGLARCSPWMAPLTLQVTRLPGSLFFFARHKGVAPAGGGQYKYCAQCPRSVGSCLDVASPTKGRIMAALHGACLHMHLASGRKSVQL